MQVILNEQEVHTCKIVAKARTRKPGGKTYRGDERSHLIGLYCESAFAKVTGLPVDFSLKNGGDPGWDFEYKGNKIQVKGRDSSKYDKPDMPINMDQLESDFYVLGWWNGKEPVIIDLVGYCTLYNLFDSKIVNLGHGDRYLVRWHELDDISNLVQNIRRGLVKSK